MEVKSICIGPLVCKKCGHISYQTMVSKIRLYSPVLIERIWTKASLRCSFCGEEYKFNEEAKRQYKLYKKNFGPHLEGQWNFELVLINTIKQFNVVNESVVDEANLKKAVQYLMDVYSKSQGFDADYYERYLRLLSVSVYKKEIREDKYFK